MALRLLPFRDYDEHEVVNIYALDAGPAVAGGKYVDLSDANKRSTEADNGVFVKVKAGGLGSQRDPMDVTADKFGAYLGSKDYPHVGRNTYPANPLTVTGVSAGSGDACLGVTLRQTATHDENGEKLQYYPVKKDELYAVLPGETVPVLSRGIVTLTDGAFSTNPAVGEQIVPSTDAGKATAWTATLAAAQNLTDAPANVIGRCIGSGNRDDAAAFGHTGNNTFKGKNSYGNYGFQSGSYFMIKLDCR